MQKCLLLLASSVKIYFTAWASQRGRIITSAAQCMLQGRGHLFSHGPDVFTGIRVADHRPHFPSRQRDPFLACNRTSRRLGLVVLLVFFKNPPHSGKHYMAEGHMSLRCRVWVSCASLSAGWSLLLWHKCASAQWHSKAIGSRTDAVHLALIGC